MATDLFPTARRTQARQRSRPHVFDRLQVDLLLIMVLLLAANLALTVAA